MAEDPPQAISVLADGLAIQNRRDIIDCTIDTTGTDQPDVGFRISTEMLTQ
jgi:hypothetical protein